MELNSASLLKALQQWIDDSRYEGRLNFKVKDALNLLMEKEIELQGLMPWSSNYTFLISLALSDQEDDNILAIYKPCDGERPLWDFPDGTLCQREFATYLISEILGWPWIPPTVLRDDGPHGRGTIQLFLEADYDAHYFNLRDKKQFKNEFRDIAIFDHLVNNADRKGGHCLLDHDGQLWAIDHGLTFNIDYKLRTVIWEYCNQPLPETMLQDLERLQQLLMEDSDLCKILSQLISQPEIQAFRDRLALLLTKGYLPNLYHGRNVPFPPI